MTKLVRTTTPSGEAIVIMSAADYDRLVELAENVEDAAAAGRAIAAYRSGRGESLVQSEIKALLEAPTPLAFWRERRFLSRADLAAAAGLPELDLVELETGDVQGEAAVYAKLAEVLGLEAEDLQPA